jgi:hypothetical protein
MRALLVVFVAPASNLAACIPKIPEPTRIQAFVPQATVKALDVTVLRGFSGLDVYRADAPLDAPG